MKVKFNRFDKTAIADIVHDYFLDVDTIYWNKENNLITMLYFKDSGGSIGAGKIIIKNVIELIFKDEEKIQYYDINYINWISKTKKIVMITNIPLLLEILVSDFAMDIEIYE